MGPWVWDIPPFWGCWLYTPFYVFNLARSLHASHVLQNPDTHASARYLHQGRRRPAPAPWLWPVLALAWQLLSSTLSNFFRPSGEKKAQKFFLPQAAKEPQIAFASPTDPAAAAAAAAAAFLRTEPVLGEVATDLKPAHPPPLASCAFIFLSSEEIMTAPLSYTK